LWKNYHATHHPHHLTHTTMYWDENILLH
jgi:hypothetical protein